MAEYRMMSKETRKDVVVEKLGSLLLVPVLRSFCSSGIF